MSKALICGYEHLRGFHSSWQRTTSTFSSTHNARGSLLGLGDESYEWDSFGELRTANNGSSNRSYLHDALGRTVGERASDGSLTWYGYDGMHRVVRHRDGIGTDYTIDGSGPDQHFLRLSDGSSSVLYYHQDRLGSVIGISESPTPGAQAKIVEWAYYTAYGKQTLFDEIGNPLSLSLVDNHFGFQGHRQDLEMGLVDMRARMYRPEWGRFLRRDPVGLASGNNMLAFVSSAPLMFTDPTGLGQWSVNISVGQAHLGSTRPAVPMPRNLNAADEFALGALEWVGDGIVGGARCFVECDSIELFKDFSDNTINTIRHPVDSADAASDALSDAAYTMHYGTAREKGQIFAQLVVAWFTRKLPGKSRAGGATGAIVNETTGALSNLGRRGFSRTAATLSDFGEGAAFSGVFNPATGRFLATPSGTTRLASGATPQNLVPRRGGHHLVEGELNTLTGASRGQNVGFTVHIQPGGGLGVEFFSRSVNGANAAFAGFVAPASIQSLIMDALRTATGRSVSAL